MPAKYIVIDNSLDEVMIIFPSFMEHADIRMKFKFRYYSVISAGFVYDDGDCLGESQSLNLKSRGSVDSQLFHRLFK